MRSVIVKNLTIQFDADQITSGDPLEQTLQAIRFINLALQRDPYMLAAQIMNEHEMTLDECAFEGKEDSTWSVLCLKTDETVGNGFDTHDQAEEWLEKQLKHEKLEHENPADYGIIEERE